MKLIIGKVYDKDEIYYSININEDFPAFDESIAKYIGVSYDEYKKILRENFNAAKLDTRFYTFFNTEKDAKAVLEWIESVLIIKKLVST